jgi:hypothetical protein
LSKEKQSYTDGGRKPDMKEVLENKGKANFKKEEGLLWPPMLQRSRADE